MTLSQPLILIKTCFVASSCLLAACGSGGGSSNPTSTPSSNSIASSSSAGDTVTSSSLGSSAVSLSSLSASSLNSSALSSNSLSSSSLSSSAPVLSSSSSSSLNGFERGVFDEASLSQALRDAQDNGDDTIDLINIEGTISAPSFGFNIDTPVTLRGTGSRGGRLMRTNDSTFLPLINVRAMNVTIENLVLVGSGQNTNTQLAAFADTDASNAALINMPISSADTRTDNLKVLNNSFENSPIGISAIGGMPRNITIANNEFNDCNRSIEFLRDVERGNGTGDLLDGGTLEITNNTILGSNIRLGISLDAGNDGSPHTASGFPNPDSQTRKDFKDKPTLYSNGVIHSNTITGAREFGIALATVGNIVVSDNTISTQNNYVLNDERDDLITRLGQEEFNRRVGANTGTFGSGINVEHNSENITLVNNTITVGTIGNFATGMTVLPFQDHGAPLNHAQATNNITLQGNTVKGTGFNAVFAFGYNNLSLIDGNDFSDFTTRNGAGVNAAFFNIPGGDSNSTERGTLNLMINSNNQNLNLDRAPQTFDQSGKVVP